MKNQLLSYYIHHIQIFKIKSDYEFNQKIQKYSFIRCLCSGVSSIVDLYNDMKLPRQVAIKKMYVKDNKVKEGDAEIEKNSMMKIKAPTCIELYDLIYIGNIDLYVWNMLNKKL